MRSHAAALARRHEVAYRKSRVGGNGATARVPERPVNAGVVRRGAPSDGAPCARASVYLPQVGLTWEQLPSAWRRATGSVSIRWFMDHFYPPAPAVPSFEAWTTAAALATATERVRLGHLVLCNAFRHPALLARCDHPRPRERRSSRPRTRQRLVRARVRAVRLELPVRAGASRATERGPRADPPAVHRGRPLVPRRTLHARGGPEPTAPRATTAPSDPRRRRRRAAHAAPRGASCRCVELPHVRARRAAAEARRVRQCRRIGRDPATCGSARKR